MIWGGSGRRLRTTSIVHEENADTDCDHIQRGQRRSLGDFGIVLCSIFKIMRNAMPNSRETDSEADSSASMYKVMVRVCIVFSLRWLVSLLGPSILPQRELGPAWVLQARNFRGHLFGTAYVAKCWLEDGLRAMLA
jgi:hypothetical protein